MTNVLNKPTLLIVDDDEAIRDALRTISESIAIPTETFVSAAAREP